MSKAPKSKTGKKKAPARSKAQAKSPEAVPETAPPRPSQTPPEAPAPVASTSSGGGKGVVALVVFLAVLVGGGYVTWPYWGHMVVGKKQVVVQKPPADTTLQQLKSERRQMREELDRMLKRMESIESAVDTVKKMIHATARPDEKAADAENMLVLSQRLKDLEKGGEDMKSLIQRMAQLENKATAPTPASITALITAKALVLAASNLRQAISLGAPFTDALDALKAVAGGDPDIEAGVVLLAKIAPVGAPTLAVLKDHFGKLAGRIVQAGRVKQKSGWMDRALARLSSLVTWRRVDGKGEAPGKIKGKMTSVDAIVADAETRLKDSDLKGAVKALDGLGANAAQKIAAPWLAAAKSRLVAERAVATLQVHTASLLPPAKK
ncbi:MAG: mitofilin family membrane protein [Proteobacteria bacterium]|nr:mitofilin family membrane protein [Pseudomonadota bacterium]MDA1023006.1 mitofilin family membrane protein [Pseudomonadota bacterium]